MTERKGRNKNATASVAYRSSNYLNRRAARSVMALKYERYLEPFINQLIVL